MTHTKLPAWFWPAVFVLIWASGYIVARFGMPHAPPFTFLAWRFVLSALCFGALIAFAALARQPAAWPQGSSQWLHLGVVGLLMHAGYLGGVWAAVKAGMGAGLVALIVNFQPVLTAIWVSQTTEHRVSKRQWLGLAVGFVGLMLVLSKKLSAGGEVTAFSLGLAVFALVTMTAGALYQKRFVAPCDVRSAVLLQLLAGMAVMLPLALLEPEPMRWAGNFHGFNAELVGAMAFSVLVLTLGGSSLLYALLRRGEAMQVTSLLYLVPPTTAVMAWLLFGESITAASLLGIGLVALGVYWAIRPAKPSETVV